MLFLLDVQLCKIADLYRSFMHNFYQVVLE